MEYEKMSDDEIYNHFCTISRQRMSQIIQKYETRLDFTTSRRLLAARTRMKERKWVSRYNAESKLVKKAKSLWAGISARCGNASGRYPSYEDCTNDFKDFTEFLNWCLTQKLFGQDETEVDKDILVRGNRSYSPTTCVIVPREVNQVLSGCLKRSGSKLNNLPLGVTYNKENRTYIAQMVVRRKGVSGYLGSFSTPQEAFQCYKEAREARLKEVAEKYKDVIDGAVYEALVNWTVEPA